MSTLVHDDTLFASHPGAPPDDDDKTLIRRCPGNPLAKTPAAAPEADSDNRPIAKLILAHDRSLTSAAASRQASRDTSTDHARGLPITVLTKDETFGAQIRAALADDHDVLVVEDVEAAAERAAAHQCPILVTDSAITRNTIEALSSRVRAQNQDVTIIASSNRDQGAQLIGLQSSGAIDGFLLKPVTTAAAELVIDAATRRHRTQTSTTGSPTRLRAKTRPPRTQRTPYTTESALATQAFVARQMHAVEPDRSLHAGLPSVASAADAGASEPLAPAQPQTMPKAAVPRMQIPRASWPIVAAIALAVGGITGWVVSQRQPAFDPHQLIEKHLALAEEAKLASRWLDPRDGAVHHYQAVLAIDPQNVAAQRGLDRVAGELSKQTQTHMSAQRFSAAALTLSQLRELQPDYPELPLLDDQLRELQAAVIAATPAEPTPAPSVEAPQRDTTVERATREKPIAIPKQAKRVQEQTKAAIPEQPVATWIRREPIGSAVIPNEPVTRPEVTAPKTQAPAATPVPVVASAAPFAPEALQPPPSQAKPAQRALLTYVEPVYPREAFLRGIDGSVTVSLQIADDGKVIDPRVESGDKRQLFARSALAAVRQWRYAPRDANTPPGNERITVKVEFKLRH